MLKSTLDIHNEKTQAMKLWIEPDAEMYLLEPGLKATITALFTTQADKDNADFAVGLTNEGTLIIYANGLADVCYIEVNGKKISPVG